MPEGCPLLRMRRAYLGLAARNLAIPLRNGTRYAALGVLAIAFGALVVLLDSLGWYYAQSALALYAQAPLTGLVSRFFLLLGLAAVIVLTGGFLVCRAILATPATSDRPSVVSLISDALSSRRAIRVGVLCAALYGLVYAFASSIVVYQPGVDFSLAYGVSTTSWNVAACCGSLGTVPTLIVYLLPQAHLALQLVPLSVLFLVAVPFLVGVNMTVVWYSLSSRQVRVTGGWLTFVGTLVGLFTGCPTCAGLFLASTLGGVGATTLSVALSPYQLLFILVSIPLLVVSPAVTAALLRRSMYAACRLPRPR